MRLSVMLFLKWEQQGPGLLLTAEKPTFFGIFECSITFCTYNVLGNAHDYNFSHSTLPLCCIQKFPVIVISV